MKRNNENRVIEIAISDHITTSFELKLDRSPQEKIDKTESKVTSDLLLPNRQKNKTRIEKPNQTKKFGSDII